MSVTPRNSAADLDLRVAEAVAAIRARSAVVPAIGLTLGSGLGGVVDAIEQATVLPTAELPHWPRSTVAGHAGRIAVGSWQDTPVVALAGRSHRYEGYALDQVTFAVRVMHALGARLMVFTNAVGAIHHEYLPGEIVVASDHINFIGKRALFTNAELAERRAGRRLAGVYDPDLRARMIAAGLRTGNRLRIGTLMGGHGPAYETAAEVRMARRFGADVACMSTVHEATVAAELGCRVVCLSCITNRATGLSATPLTHHEVTEVADRVAGSLRAVLAEFLRTLAAADGARA